MSATRCLRAATLAAVLPALLLLVPRAEAVDLVPSYLASYGAGHVSYPRGIAIGQAGDIFVVNWGQRRIEKFSRTGLHLAGWGGWGSGPGQFDDPYGIAVAPSGDVYVVDLQVQRVQRFAPDGTYLGAFGTPGTGPGEFAYPRGVAVDGLGQVYVADTYNHRVQKFTAAGTYLGEWGSQGSGEGQLYIPWGLAVDAAGDVYVADTYNQRIQKFSSTGTFLRAWGTPGAGDGQFTYPSAVSVDRSGNVYVTDTNNHRIQRFTSTGVFVSRWGAHGGGAGEFEVPQGVAVAWGGDVHVSDTNHHRIEVFRARGCSGHEFQNAWGSQGSGNGQFVNVRGVAVAPDGSVYVADLGTDRVQKYSMFGGWDAAWGTSGTGDGEFDGPIGVAVDAAGTVFVTDLQNSRVQRFTGAGVFLSKWGGPGPGAGQFNAIGDVAIGPADEVYVVDDQRVQRFTTGGAFVTQWGVSNARGICTDPEGSVYVACAGDYVVRKYAPDGTFLLQWGSQGSGPGQFDYPVDVVADTAGYVYVCDGGNRIQQFTALGGYVAEWGATGAAYGELNSPQMMAMEPAGNLLVTELLNYRVQRFASPAELLEVEDVPGDEGNAVRLHFTRSSAEGPGTGNSMGMYEFHRRSIDPPIWASLGSIAPDGVTTSHVVPSPANATAALAGMTEYRVRVVLNNAYAFPLTGQRYGFSVDNLAPPAPSPFTAAYVSGSTHLHWGASPAADLEEYRLYRGEAPGFALTPAALVVATADTGYSDPGPPGRWYQVVAADTNGNVGAPAQLGPGETVSVPDAPAPPAFALAEPRPNPVRGGALLASFTLPGPAEARLALLDVAGRVVAERAVRGAGPHQVSLAGPRALAAGIYFVRLSQERSAQVRRVVVLE